MPLYECRQGGRRFYTRNREDCNNPVEIIDEKNLVRISKLMSRILRHEPEKFNVNIDPEGWVFLDDLVRSLRKVIDDDLSIGKDVITGIALTDPKNRFQIQGDRIRATYGHSINVSIGYPESAPKVLYHGTQIGKLNSILRRGLLPGRRLYVHLSPTPVDACIVARRRSGTPIYLVIDAEKTRKSGYPIYQATPRVFLVKRVPPEAIESYGYCEQLQR